MPILNIKLLYTYFTVKMSLHKNTLFSWSASDTSIVGLDNTVFLRYYLILISYSTGYTPTT